MPPTTKQYIGRPDSPPQAAFDAQSPPSVYYYKKMGPVIEDTMLLESAEVEDALPVATVQAHHLQLKLKLKLNLNLWWQMQCL